MKDKLKKVRSIVRDTTNIRTGTLDVILVAMNSISRPDYAYYLIRVRGLLHYIRNDRFWENARTIVCHCEDLMGLQ